MPVKDISPQQAWEILSDNPSTVLLDVRTRVEYEYVGHALNSLNIPWVEAPSWQIDPDFVEKVRMVLKREEQQPLESTAILAICRSGKRSKAALQALAEEGFNVLYNIEEGFEGDLDENGHRNTINGWRFAGLPWRQS